MSTMNLFNRAMLPAVALSATILSRCTLRSAAADDEPVMDDQEALIDGCNGAPGCAGSSLNGHGPSFNGYGSGYNGYGSGYSGYGSGIPGAGSSCGTSCGMSSGGSCGATAFPTTALGINSFGGDPAYSSCGGSSCKPHP